MWDEAKILTEIDLNVVYENKTHCNIELSSEKLHEVYEDKWAIALRRSQY